MGPVWVNAAFLFAAAVVGLCTCVPIGRLLWEAGGGAKPDGKKWTDQLAEELHKPVRRKFKRRQVISHGIDDIWAADLVEMQPFAKYNKGFKYILTVIDIFSKYAFMVPLKDKKGMSVSKAFSEIFKESGRRPNKVWTDKGREFYNKDVKRLGVPLYSTENEQKSSVVERFNRTLKERMYKYFTANNTNVYFDILDSLVSQYNKSKHRAIKMTPIEASKKKNEGIVHENLYGSEAKTSKAKFKLGDYVRIVKKKGTFEHGFTPRWTEEVFQISSSLDTDPVTYKIIDFNNEEIKGSFYEQELQKTSQETYRIEKVLRRRGKGPNKELFVKWKGYGPEFNSWIPAKDVTL